MVSRTAKNSQRSRRGSPAAATASGGPPDLSAAEVGDKIEVQHTDQRWYPAKVIAKRSVANAATQLRYRYDGHRNTNPGKWISITEPNVRSVTTDDNRLQRLYGGCIDGHVEEDVWCVDSILDERGDGESKEYLVHWAGWDGSHDSWESQDSILDESVIADFIAARDAAARAAEKAARAARAAERAPYAATAIKKLRRKLLVALRKQKNSAKFKTIAQLEICDEWLLLAIHDFLASTRAHA